MLQAMKGVQTLFARNLVLGAKGQSLVTLKFATVSPPVEKLPDRFPLHASIGRQTHSEYDQATSLSEFGWVVFLRVGARVSAVEENFCEF